MTVDGVAVAEAAAVLRRGGLVAFPTETVYGLGADAADPDAVAHLFAVKGRPVDHPLIVHLAAARQLDDWSDGAGEVAHRLAEAFWPGPLTLIVPRSGLVPDEVTGGRDTVGLRVPDHPVAHALLVAFGGGIAAPSANRFGRVSPTTAAHVRADLGAEVEVVLDGGPARVGVESTIVDCTGPQPEILRPGAIAADHLAVVLGAAPARWSGAGPSRAPGMLDAHYAPRARVVLTSVEDVHRTIEDEQRAAPGDVVAVLAPTVTDGLPSAVVELEPAGGPEDYAHVLYDRLRQADRLGVTVLVVVPPADEGVGTAVLDRLRRAAATSRPR